MGSKKLRLLKMYRNNIISSILVSEDLSDMNKKSRDKHFSLRKIKDRHYGKKY